MGMLEAGLGVGLPALCGPRGMRRTQVRSGGVGEPAAPGQVDSRVQPCDLRLSTLQLAEMHCCSWQSC